MNILRAFSIFLLGIVFFACSNEPAETEESEFVLSAEGAIFREVNMGDSPGDVKSAEKAEPVFLSDTLMQYRTELAWKGTKIGSDLYYNFDEYGLFEIQADYFAAESKRDSLFQSMNNLLTEEYGSPSRNFESLRWTTPSASNTLIEISLSKEIDLEGHSFISLNYLEPLNEEL